MFAYIMQGLPQYFEAAPSPIYNSLETYDFHSKLP